MILTDDDIEDARGPFPAYASEWSDDDFVQFSRAVEREVLRKLREREPSCYLIDWPDEPDLGDYFAYEPSGCGRSRPLHIIPEVNE